MKRLKRALQSLFAERKLIIISDAKVRNIPISGKLQTTVALGVLGGVAWLCYATGLYFGYQQMMDSKQDTIREISMENQELVTKNSLMYRDMMRLVKEGGTQAEPEYQSFLLQHYADAETSEVADSALLGRIAYLEGRLSELENYQQRFLDGLQRHTGKELEHIRTIIDMTGLDGKELGLPIVTNDDDKNDKLSMRKHDAQSSNDYDYQGGPLIEASTMEPEFQLASLTVTEDKVIEKVAALIEVNNLYDSLPLAFPVKQGRITSGFGIRRDPINRRRAMHSGLDFAAPHHSSVYATAPGTVIFAGRQGAYGNLVEIDHGNQIITRYAHLSSISVKEGDKVERDSVIGEQGSTGRSTGHHLHYEVRYKNRPMDPRKFIKAGIYARKKS